MWTARDSGSGSVIVGNPDGTTFSVDATVQTFTPATTKLSFSFYQYQADITGLKSGVTYAYRPTVNGQTVTPRAGNFTTAAPGDVSFLVFGDSGEDTPQQLSLIQMMIGEPNIKFVVHMGDLAYPQGTYALYDSQHFGLNAPLMDHLAFFPTPGNHDYLADAGVAYVSMHARAR